MFTGIVEEVGIIQGIRPSGAGGAARFTIRCPKIRPGIALGDSVAINGLCLTAEHLEPEGFAADVMPESVRRSNLGTLQVGSRVNAERALQVGGRLGGHIVTGHIDGTGQLKGVRQEGNALWVEITCPSALSLYLAPKGSIAIDGVSLTLAKILPEGFAVSLIPHTVASTTLATLTPGRTFNLECDLIGKYIYRYLRQGVFAGEKGEAGSVGSAVSEEATNVPKPLDEGFLREHGFL